jgi:hypothetical protein
MKNLNPPTFFYDQYFILKKNSLGKSLGEIERLVNSANSEKVAFEKAWIPEDQITGEIKKLDVGTFEMINRCFEDNFKQIIENETRLQELELLAVRRNILHVNDYVSMHRDYEGYVVIIDIPETDYPEENEGGNTQGYTIDFKRSFEGGNILFTKDNGEVVEIELQRDEVLVAKCTNNHGVKKVVSGTRESIALFSRPRI